MVGIASSAGEPLKAARPVPELKTTLHRKGLAQGAKVSAVCEVPQGY
jgi:hypothetical protein